MMYYTLEACSNVIFCETILVTIEFQRFIHFRSIIMFVQLRYCNRFLERVRSHNDFNCFLGLELLTRYICFHQFKLFYIDYKASYFVQKKLISIKKQLAVIVIVWVLVVLSFSIASGKSSTS